jgi:hypothetical protein
MFRKIIFFTAVALISNAPALYGQTRPAIEIVETAKFDLKGCVQMYQQKQFVIKDKDSYLKNLRNDAQTEECRTEAKNLDFEKYSYLGMQVNSGYCRLPKGLEYGVIKDTSKKKYQLTVSYTDPEGQVCRALSRYDLWVRVPKLQKDYQIDFQIEVKPRN